MGRPIVTLGGASGQNINLGQSDREPHKLGHQRGGGRCAQKRARYLTPNAFGGRRTASESTGCRRLSAGPSCGGSVPCRLETPSTLDFLLLSGGFLGGAELQSESGGQLVGGCQGDRWSATSGEAVHHRIRNASGHGQLVQRSRFGFPSVDRFSDGRFDVPGCWQDRVPFVR